MSAVLALGPVAVAAAALGVGVVLLWLALCPPAAVLVLVAVVASNMSAVLANDSAVTPYLVALTVTAIAALIAARRRLLKPVWSPIFLFAMIYLATRAISLVGAEDVGAGVAVLVTDAKSVVLLVVLTTVLVSVPGLRQAAMVAVGVIALLAGLSIVQDAFLQNATTFAGFSNVPIQPEAGVFSARHSGPETDVNFWGRTIVVVLPLALSFVADRRLRFRWVWLAPALALFGGLYLTQSRGAFLAATAAVAVWLLMSRRPRVQTVLAVVAGASAVFFVPGVGSRIATLTKFEAGPESRSDPSLVNRVAVMRVGFAMAAEHPVIGVGPGNFTIRVPEYRRRAAPELSEVLAPHNLYLQMLAESGVLGLIGWLVFFGGGVLVAFRGWLVARAIAPRGPPTPALLLGAGVVAGLLGWGAASVFLHLSGFQMLLVVVSIGAALDLRARATYAAAGSPAPPRRPPRTFRGAVALLATATMAVAIAAAAVNLTMSRSPSWSATARTSVVPLPAPHAYLIDVLSRPKIMTTVATLAASPTFLRQGSEAAALPESAMQSTTLEVTHPPRTDFLDFRVTAADRATAARLAPATVAAAAATINRLGSFYRLSPQPTEVVTASSAGFPRLPIALLVVAVLAAVALARELSVAFLSRRRAGRSVQPFAS